MSERPSFRCVFVLGVPRSGTTVLHALMCTSPEMGPYIGEASYIRMLLAILPRAEGMFDQHTRYAFPTLDELRSFHSSMTHNLRDAYWTTNGRPDCLILKDPLLTDRPHLLRQMLPETEIVLMLRHPADVIASRLQVQTRMNVSQTIDKVIAEHNDLLKGFIDNWDASAPVVVTYSMLAEEGLTTLRQRLAMPNLQPDLLWKKALKAPTKENQTAWVTSLSGGPLAMNSEGRNQLSTELRRRIDTECLPLCHQILQRAGLDHDDPYWQPATAI